MRHLTNGDAPTRTPTRPMRLGWFRGGGYRRCRPSFTVERNPRQEPWRARCVETRTAGSASGPGKRTSSNAGTAPQADSTVRAHCHAALRAEPDHAAGRVREQWSWSPRRGVQARRSHGYRGLNSRKRSFSRGHRCDSARCSRRSNRHGRPRSRSRCGQARSWPALSRPRHRHRSSRPRPAGAEL